ncbi:hypothetical protein ACVD55_000323 [Vibrio alginolyticus]
MTNSELKALARSELVKILQSDSDKAFTAKCKLIQLVLTDQLSPPKTETHTEDYTPEELNADYGGENVLQLVGLTVVDPTLEEKTKDAL